jgi:hypothetical protein
MSYGFDAVFFQINFASDTVPDSISDQPPTFLGALSTR